MVINNEDTYTEQVKTLILELLDANPTRVYYGRQLEVKYEKQYYHWVTDRAIRELKEEHKALVEPYPTKSPSGKINIITNRRNRYYKREAKKTAKLVEEYSAEEITKDIGFIAEELFKTAYARYHYELVGENMNKYKGKEWGKTGHDIDFIVEKKGFAFGCEVKNTLGYIEKKELDIKIELCQYLGIIPIFILRYSPFEWNNEVISKGGIVQIFETQIYSPGRAELVKKLKNELELPVLVSKRIPDSIMERVEKVVTKYVF